MTTRTDADLLPKSLIHFPAQIYVAFSTTGKSNTPTADLSPLGYREAAKIEGRTLSIQEFRDAADRIAVMMKGGESWIFRVVVTWCPHGHVAAREITFAIERDPSTGELVHRRPLAAALEHLIQRARETGTVDAALADFHACWPS